MTPGTIDLGVVSERLGIATACLRDLRALPTSSLEEFQSDPRNPAAAESFLRRGIESLLDVARHLLAKAFGDSAVEYRTVALRAAERGLIVDPAVAKRFPELAGYRNRLTHFYADVTPRELFDIVTSRLGDLESTADELRQAAARLGPST